MRAHTLAVLLLAGCFGGGGSGGSGARASGASLAGNAWTVEAATTACVAAFIFDDDGEHYEVDLVCVLTTARVGIMGELGTYRVDGDTITFMPEASTCPDDSGATYEVRFSILDDGRLRLVNDSGVILAEPVTDSGSGSAAAAFGCFDGDGFWFDNPWSEF